MCPLPSNLIASTSWNPVGLSRPGIGLLYLKMGKAIPLQAWTDPEVSRRLRLPDFKTVGT
jgi:hypothetical protein